MLFTIKTVAIQFLLTEDQAVEFTFHYTNIHNDFNFHISHVMTSHEIVILMHHTIKVNFSTEVL